MPVRSEPCPPPPIPAFGLVLLEVETTLAPEDALTLNGLAASTTAANANKPIRARIEYSESLLRVLSGFLKLNLSSSDAVSVFRL